MQSAQWFVRVDGEPDVLRPKVKGFAEHVDNVDILAVSHTGRGKENPHCHFLVSIRSPIQKQSMAIRIKSHFEVVNRGYALAVWDGKKLEEGASTYLFHEPNAHILFSRGWSDSDLKEVQRLGGIVRQAVEKEKEKASTKLIDRALKHFEGGNPDKFQIFAYMMEEVASKKAYWPGTFKIKQYVEEVEIKLSQNLPRLINEMYANIFRS